MPYFDQGIMGGHAGHFLKYVKQEIVLNVFKAMRRVNVIRACVIEW
jgi:hypothetical protein